MAEVMTAPLAIIKVQGESVGFMKDIRATEDLRRGKVSGLGALIARELPALEWTGRLTCSFYSIDLSKTGIPNALIRSVPTVRAWIDTVLLQEDGVDIVCYKKVADVFDPTTQLISSRLEEYITVRGAFIEQDAFDINEGQIAGRNQSFAYLNPIVQFT